MRWSCIEQNRKDKRHSGVDERRYPQTRLNIPVLAGLGENLTELPVDWRLMLESTSEEPC